MEARHRPWSSSAIGSSAVFFVFFSEPMCFCFHSLLGHVSVSAAGQTKKLFHTLRTPEVQINCVTEAGL